MRLETIASVEGRPANVGVSAVATATRPGCSSTTSTRARSTPTSASWRSPRRRWPPIHSLDAKFTTTDLAKELKTLGPVRPAAGPDLAADARGAARSIPEIQPLVSNPWTILHADAAGQAEADGRAAVDLHDPDDDDSCRHDDRRRSEHADDRAGLARHAVPKTDADVWLASAFADYERIVALEKALTASDRRAS